MRRDWWMCAAVLALAAFGVLVQVRLAGSVPELSGLAPLLTGLLGGVAAALMLALLVFGRRYRGGLYLPGRINPSELVKLCLAAFLAGWMGKPGRTMTGLFLCGALFLMVAAAGDFGLLAQLAITVAALLWAASWFWGGAAFLALAGGMAFAAAYPSGHLATRFAVWRDPFGDVTGAGWQTLQGLAAVLSGGITGAGFGLGEVQAVPIVASDFVYAAVAEELGLAGCMTILALWAFVFARGICMAARRTADAPAEALLATGIVASLAVQLVLNILHHIGKGGLFHFILHAPLHPFQFCVHRLVDVSADRAFGIGMRVEMEQSVVVDAVGFCSCQHAGHAGTDICTEGKIDALRDADQPGLLEIAHHIADDNRIDADAAGKHAAGHLFVFAQKVDHREQMDADGKLARHLHCITSCL